jgi:microcystin-dependent protein
MSPAPVDPVTATAHTTARAVDVNARFLALFRALNGADIGLDIDSLAASLREMLAQAGDIRATGRPAVSTGWLACNGAAVSRATYAGLFAAIGTAFGAGDGSTTFNVPDLQGRSPLGAGAGAGLTARTRGTKYGSEDIKAHSHTINGIATLGAGGTNANVVIGSANTGTTGTGTDNLHPSQGVTFEIKT